MFVEIRSHHQRIQIWIGKLEVRFSEAYEQKYEDSSVSLGFVLFKI